MKSEFWFKSSKLKIIEGEDEETNPFVYGKSLALWISKSFQEKGYKTELFPEDWGWRIDCISEPCIVWIACGNVVDLDNEDSKRR